MPEEVEEGQEIAVEVGSGGSGRSSAINVTIASSSSDLEPPNTAGKHKLKIICPQFFAIIAIIVRSFIHIPASG